MMDGAMSRSEVRRMVDRAPQSRSLQSLKTVPDFTLTPMTPLKKSKIGITRKLLNESKRFSVTNTATRLAAKT
jgi:hypothetical protein